MICHSNKCHRPRIVIPNYSHAYSKCTTLPAADYCTPASMPCQTLSYLTVTMCHLEVSRTPVFKPTLPYTPEESMQRVISAHSQEWLATCTGFPIFAKRDHCTALWAVQHPSMTPTGFFSACKTPECTLAPSPTSRR